MTWCGAPSRDETSVQAIDDDINDADLRPIEVPARVAALGRRVAALEVQPRARLDACGPQPASSKLP